MTIRNDAWIRQMVAEEQMIDPYVDGQVSDGVISYGLSSFGYDIRITDEFKIFTPATGQLTVVDPKAIDESCMVSYRGDTCIIPPNSFALARTVEYFRIPRNVLTVCLGKSTYARCFSGDTKVKLADGDSVSLEDMVQRYEQGEEFFGYSIMEDSSVIITRLEAPRKIGTDRLIEIMLDDGSTIKTTPDHKFIRRNGEKVRADSLRKNDSLMPLYMKEYRGYTGVYMPNTGFMYPAHRLADEWNLRNGIYDARENTHRHHIDHDKRNNYPTNIERVDASEHIKHHNDSYYNSEEFDAEAHGEAVKNAIAELSKDPEWLEMYSESQRKSALAFWHDPKNKKARQVLIEKQIESWTDDRKGDASRRMTQYYSDPKNRDAVGERSKEAWAIADKKRRLRQAEIMRNVRLREDITEDAVRDALIAAGTIRGAARLLNCDRTTFRRFKPLVEEFKAGKLEGEYKNHKVASIKEIQGMHDVYCMTVPEAGNFALDCGVFVENCGIIVNVTPFEPEWEGFVTIEISNTTPLPAKIYANEGIAQVLFFEGDEPEVSYADRKGKYQGQAGIQTAKV